MPTERDNENAERAAEELPLPAVVASAFVETEGTANVVPCRDGGDAENPEKTASLQESGDPRSVGDQNGPPAHWLNDISERAPHLLERFVRSPGHRSADSNVPPPEAVSAAVGIRKENVGSNELIAPAESIADVSSPDKSIGSVETRPAHPDTKRVDDRITNGEDPLKPTEVAKSSIPEQTETLSQPSPETQQKTDTDDRRQLSYFLDILMEERPEKFTAESLGQVPLEEATPLEIGMPPTGDSGHLEPGSTKQQSQPRKSLRPAKTPVPVTTFNVKLKATANSKDAEELACTQQRPSTGAAEFDDPEIRPSEESLSVPVRSDATPSKSNEPVSACAATDREDNVLSRDAKSYVRHEPPRTGATRPIDQCMQRGSLERRDSVTQEVTKVPDRKNETILDGRPSPTVDETQRRDSPRKDSADDPADSGQPRDNAAVAELRTMTESGEHSESPASKSQNTATPTPSTELPAVQSIRDSPEQLIPESSDHDAITAGTKWIGVQTGDSSQTRDSQAVTFAEPPIEELWPEFPVDETPDWQDLRAVADRRIQHRRKLELEQMGTQWNV